MATTKTSGTAEETVSTQRITCKERRRLQNPDRKRHGARNQHKMKHFVRWLIETFPEVFDSSNGAPILDVAGGKGELAARLCVCHQRKVIVVDPRRSDPKKCFQTDVLPKIPKKWQERHAERTKDDPDFLDSLFEKQFLQFAAYFDDNTLAADAEIAGAVQECCLLIGMHADGATEAIVDAALRHDKPFVVVPCCVFPNLFPKRRVELQGKTVDVRTHEQFCQYLAAKDARLATATLPFEGRNTAIYYRPTSDQ